MQVDLSREDLDEIVALIDQKLTILREVAKRHPRSSLAAIRNVPTATERQIEAEEALRDRVIAAVAVSSPT